MPLKVGTAAIGYRGDKNAECLRTSLVFQCSVWKIKREWGLKVVSGAQNGLVPRLRSVTATKTAASAACKKNLQ